MSEQAVIELPAEAQEALNLLEKALNQGLLWRLNNLYTIIDEGGKSIPFRLNEEQTDFVQRLWYRNLILKARQLGFSTLIEILSFDQALFNSNHNGVVIADTVPNAGKLFGKIEHALKNLDKDIAQAFPIESRTASTSLKFRHGSSIYVSTSSRGGTVQLLHVSEFGKISRKYPERAAEIVSGAFPSVPKDGCIIVESTAEGAAGEFYDLVMPALKRMREGTPETQLDWRLHFYPWWKKASYALSDDDAKLVPISERHAKYFREHEAKLGITFTPGQKAWYVKTEETLKRKMKREHPTTPEEAFEQAVEGAIFGEEMTLVREKGRITEVPFLQAYKVNTFWDFGQNDATAIWFHQRVGLQNRWWKYIEGSGTGLGKWWTRLENIRKDLGFLWGKHLIPHDADARIQGETIENKKEILHRLGMRDYHVVGRIPDKTVGIELMREKLPNDNWFDRIECADGIKAIDGYQYEWDPNMGQWKTHPLHNWASNGVDAWMQYAQEYDSVSRGISGPDDKNLKAFMNRKRGI